MRVCKHKMRCFRSLANYLMSSFLSETIMDADNAIMVEWLKYNSKNPEMYCTNKIFRYELDYSLCRGFNKSFGKRKSYLPHIFIVYSDE